MRRIPRKTLAAAGTLVVALGLSGNAWATGATENTSQVLGSLNPPVLPASGAKPANLFTQTSTYDTDNNNGCTPNDPPGDPEDCFPPIPAQAAVKTTVDFPNDMVYTTNSKLDQCAAADINVSTEDAVNACRGAVIGGGNALARIPGFPTANNETQLTVTAFNGPTSTAGGGFDGGFPEILLHADSPTLPTTLVQGEVRNSPNGADYGRQLHVPVVNLISGGAGALVLFNSQLGRTWDNGKSGNKLKKYNLITSTCDAGDLDFRADWTYEDLTTDTDTSTQDCVN